MGTEQNWREACEEEHNARLDAEAQLAASQAEAERLRGLLREFVDHDFDLLDSVYSFCQLCHMDPTYDHVRQSVIYRHEADCLFMRARAALATEERRNT